MYKTYKKDDGTEIVLPSSIPCFDYPSFYYIGIDRDGQCYSANLFEIHSPVIMPMEQYNKIKERLCEKTIY